MGKGVHDKLVMLYSEHTGCGPKEAIEFWQQRAKNGEYLRELWG
jgi:hypothetical protein